MLFLFRGKHGPVVRAILGALMLVVGMLLKGWLILVAIGAVLLVWGVIGLIGAQRIRHRKSLRSDRREA